MILHSDKKVVCVRDIPSNIFEEAIFILKENVLENEEENEERTKEIILREAEDIVEEYNYQLQCDEEVFEEEEPTKSLKGEIIYVVSLLIVLGICIASVM